MAGERVPITREQMNTPRRWADKAATGGNVFEGVVIVGGLVLNPVVGGAAAASLLLGRHMQEEYIRKAPVEHVIYQAKKQATKKDYDLAA